MIERRGMIAGGLALAMLPGVARASGGSAMYGMIGRMKAIPGRRDALIAILLDSTGAMPGCMSYIVAKDASDPDAIWVTEVWDTKASHDASLKLPQVQAAIAKARPIIAGFDSSAETEPVGGYGLRPWPPD